MHLFEGSIPSGYSHEQCESHYDSGTRYLTSLVKLAILYTVILFSGGHQA